MLFKIIDRKTGKEPTDRVITAQARLGNLITRDIDGFYVGEDGQIILVDDCGNCTWLDIGRFKVELQTEASPTSCSTCILDNTDACTRGAGRAVDDEACEDYLASPTGSESEEI